MMRTSMASIFGVDDFFHQLADWFADRYREAIKFIVKMIFKLSLPTPSALQSEWFLFGIGGNLGLAFFLWKFVVIIIGFVAIAGTMRSMSEKRRLQLSRIMPSFLVLVAFSYGFFPVYSMIYDADQHLVKLMIALITGQPSGSLNGSMRTLFDIALPANIAGKMLAAGFSSFFGLIALIEALALYVTTIVVLIFYPLTIALRPLGKITNDIFNAANSAILVCLFSPPLMIFGILLPVVVSKVPVLGDVGALSALAAVLGGLFAMCVPALLGYFLFKKSSEVFGFVDSNLAGALDIDRMPPVTTRAMEESVTETHESAIGSFSKSVAGGTLAAAISSDSGEEFFGQMKNVAIDAVGVATTVAGHPEVGAAINLANDKRKGGKPSSESDQTKGDD